MSNVRSNGDTDSQRPLRKIAILGNFPPRQCGIATFTSDLAQAISQGDSELTIDTIAVSDRPGYDYPPRVRYEVREQDLASFRLAASYINRNDYDLLSVQHEYGIYGGEAGEYLMGLVRDVKMPIVTTLHTVLQDPTPTQKAVLDELLQLSERVVVMSQKAIEYLKDVHGVSPAKVDFIPHGIPSIPNKSNTDIRKKLGIDGPMILTFGLLSPDKGIQYMIEAMPAIVKEHPGATYVIVGVTHPNIRTNSGESYREGLAALAAKHGVAENVRFIDRFVEIDELVDYLAATDIYITPYLNPKQITSGTLAYAIGAAKAVISTPYVYAKELLADGRGALVPFRDSKAIAEAVLAIQGDLVYRKEMIQKASDLAKQMLWPAVGKNYLNTFNRAKRDGARRLQALVHNSADKRLAEMTLPDLKLDHLLDLTDGTGIIQHATFTTPNRSEGYCVDDNARALILTALVERESPLSPDLAGLQSRYLGFVLDAYNPLTGQFRNFMDYRRNWLEEAGSEDSQGRSLWSLGVATRYCRDVSRRDLAKALFEKSFPALLQTQSLRTWAYSIIAADEYLAAFPREAPVRAFMIELASRLWEQYKANKTQDWLWFENRLTYGNARLAQALILAGRAFGDREMLASGLASLRWLMRIQTGPKGVFAPIGSNGFYLKNETRNYFDQQPIEASSTLSACLTANQVTLDPAWLEEAIRAFGWFMGENMLNTPAYDKTTGGCYDGLQPQQINRNQGAESTLSFLCALTELRWGVTPAHMKCSIKGQYGLK